MCTREAPQSALGWFGRFNAIKDPPEYRGYLNLKHMGTLPLVSGVRLFALREGIEIGSTLERMTALHQQGTFNADDHDELSSAYTLLAELLLNQQIADFSNGRRVTNFVHPNSLTKHRRQLMKQAFKAINAFGERVRFEFAGEVY
jgi:CBS domain-containing protein